MFPDILVHPTPRCTFTGLEMRRLSDFGLNDENPFVTAGNEQVPSSTGDSGNLLLILVTRTVH